MLDTQAAIVVIADTRKRDGLPPLALQSFWGTPLVRHVTQSALEAACGPVVVVSGEHASFVKHAISGLHVDTVASDPRSRGSVEALQAALRALDASRRFDAVVAIRAEQVLVTGGRIRQLVSACRTQGRALAVARHRSGVGLPACFNGYTIDWLLTLPRGAELDACVEKAGADCVYLECPEAEPTAAQGLTSGLYAGIAWTAQPTVHAV
ncbi:MAG: NTP transferase domain-containing protein [Vicinamibacterales bacterium]